MRKRFTLAAVGAGTVLMLASTVGTAAAQTPADGSASAPAVIKPISVDRSQPGASVWDNCLHGQACIFQNSDGGGLLWVVPSAGSFKLGNYNMSDRTSSVWNRSGGNMNLYDYSDFTGLLSSFGPYGPPINIPTGINDKASSLTLY
ncbi:peptidase inhibitor family I36 protein [Streptomyces sp. G-G2]|uniref:peptidase inhibitor family I36 protein n=1 Tax=Streptomyces sp. G-G2 TaxID=3046201 RepID=UPI0024B931FA|nr:peptidase inhibitor family I36 protein [Streptomyces sp. G-G2]MDJ0382452.1 peptidase inhibitor family I36 protein [Streptomyces sp. G-G2]